MHSYTILASVIMLPLMLIAYMNILVSAYLARWKQES